jgi:hypothetical protein
MNARTGYWDFNFVPDIKIKLAKEDGEIIRGWSSIILVELIGTPKQIAWATSIQESMLNTVHVEEIARGELDMMAVIKNKIANTTSSEWFINHNNIRKSFFHIARSLGVNEPEYYPMPPSAYLPVPVPESLHPEIAAIINERSAQAYANTHGTRNANINTSTIRTIPAVKAPAETHNSTVEPLPENKDLLEQDQIARYAAIELY